MIAALSYFSVALALKISQYNGRFSHQVFLISAQPLGIGHDTFAARCRCKPIIAVGFVDRAQATGIAQLVELGRDAVDDDNRFAGNVLIGA